MSMNDTIDKQATQKMRLPRWSAAVYFLVAGPVVHIGIPWAISLLARRHGWVAGHPGTWNWLGLIPVAAGLSCIAWCASMHIREMPGAWVAETTPQYLMVRGPYKYSRNPIYLAVLPIWVGWTVFYGSISVAFAVVAILLAGWPLGVLVVGREERSLEARFGESYLAYKKSVSRWFGRRVAP